MRDFLVCVDGSDATGCGVIRAALHLDLGAGIATAPLTILVEGTNGHLPNLDLVNVAVTAADVAYLRTGLSAHCIPPASNSTAELSFVVAASVGARALLDSYLPGPLTDVACALLRLASGVGTGAHSIYLEYVLSFVVVVRDSTIA